MLCHSREALSITLRHEGVLGLWKGCAATLLRDVPFSALYWPFYEGFRSLLLGGTEERARLGEAELLGGTFLAGAAAGSIAAAVTLPMDVIKTRWGDHFSVLMYCRRTQRRRTNSLFAGAK